MALHVACRLYRQYIEASRFMTMRLRSATVTPILCCVLFCITPGYTRAADTIDKITDSWEERQTSIRTLDCEWNEKWIVEKGHWYDGKNGSKSSAALPPNDIEFTAHVRLRLKGNKYRYEASEQIWSVRENKLVPRTSISTSDEIKAVNYTPVSDLQYPAAVINKAPSSGDGAEVRLKPITLLYRPLSAGLGGLTSLTDFHVVGDTSRGSAILLERHSVNSGSSSRPFTSLSIDSLTSSIVRYVAGRIRSDGTRQVSTALDLELDNTASSVVKPKAWRLRFSGGQRASFLVEASIVSCALNVTIDDSLFSQTSFEVGTWVTDQSNEEVTRWLVEDVGNRPILRGDWGASYEQIRNSPPGEATMAGTFWYGRIWIIAFIGLLSIVLVVLLYRLRVRANVT